MGIQSVLMSFSEIYQQPMPWPDKVLGGVCFVEPMADRLNVNEVKIPIAQLHAPILASVNFCSANLANADLNSTDASCEIWLSNQAMSSGISLSVANQGTIQYRFNDEFLFGVIIIPEPVSLENGTDIALLQHASECAYREIFALMEKFDYRHIYRFWNYMADINGISHGLERYRQFNVGRKDAFLAYSGEIGDQLPAACALGLVEGPLTIAFLLGRQAATAIENPRQVSAYKYPEEYGPRTPSFSRATLLRTGKNALLFISGTASIVGHATLHPLDVAAQTRETLANLDAVIAEANRMLGEQKFDLHNIHFRVYVRYAADLSLVQHEMQRHIGGKIKALFIQADICRQELLLEIEATAGYISELAGAE